MPDDRETWNPLLLVPNALTRSDDLKPATKRRWIDLAENFGPLDYKVYWYAELEELWGMGKKPVQAMLRNLSNAGFLATEDSRDKDVRVYLFPTSDKPEEHLAAIKETAELAHRGNARRTEWNKVHLEPYRNRYLKRHGHFTMIPPVLVKDERLTHNDVIAYVVIRGADGKWGKRALAKAANVSERTYYLSQQKLEELGYMSHDVRPRKVNRYTFSSTPESLSPQMASPSPQMASPSPQMASGVTPMNTKSNTEVNTKLDSDPKGEAQGLGENRDNQDKHVLTEGIPGTELSHSVRRTLASLGTKEQTSTEGISDLNRGNASYPGVTKEEREREMSVHVPGTDDPSDIADVGPRTHAAPSAVRGFKVQMPQLPVKPVYVAPERKDGESDEDYKRREHMLFKHHVKSVTEYNKRVELARIKEEAMKVLEGV